jgi:fibronectin-binding autotransporter adhesin
LNFSLGANGQGTLTVANGGSVFVGETLSIAVNAGSVGTLNIGAASGQAAAAAGAITTPSVVFGAGTGKIVFNHTDTGYVFGADVSGTGSIRTEAGTTIFTGTSTYSGGTTIAGGTLQLGNGGIAGSITGDVTDNTTLAFNRSNAYGFGGIISGSGAVQQNGAGTTTLSAANTYGGGTFFNAGTLSVAANTNLGAGAGALNFSGGVLQVTGTAFTSTARTINGGVNGGGFDIADANNAFTVNQAIGSGGALSKLGAGSLVLTAANLYVGGTTIAAGTLQLGNGGTTGSITGDVTNNGILAFNRANAYQFDGTISGNGIVQQNRAGVTTLTAANTYRGGTMILAGTLQLGDGGTSGSIIGNVLDNATFAVNRSDTYSFAGQISGSGAFEQLGTGTTILTNANTYAGGTTIASGTLRVENNAALGSGAVTTTGSVLDYASGIALANPIQINSTHTQLQVLAGTATQGDVISEFNGPRPLEKIGAGSLVPAAINSYTGPTTVSGGTLDVPGSIASSSLISVGANAMLSGTGVVGSTTIANGGAFRPGNGTPGSSMTVSGNLALQSGALYLVQVNATASSFANVSGGATLGGTVSASYGNSGNLAKRYTILSAAGGIGGTFGSLANTNLPPNFTTSLSYDTTHAYLNLSLNFTPPGAGAGLTGNQQSVGNALTGSFNANGGIPIAFGALSPAGLTQLSGEAATGTQQTTFQAMNLFMGVLLDPWLDGRDGNDLQGSASAFANDNDAGTGNASTSSAGKVRSRSESEAYAAIYAKAPQRLATFEQRWSVWTAGFGGSQTTYGNATLGSNAATSRVYGTVVGADYRLAPDTLAGFALAGGGTGFSIANALGRGSSDVFQAAAFIRHTHGAAYLSGALAYGWQDITTDRTVTIAGIDRLNARFKANAFSGRVEAGYRLVTPWTGIGLTPYAAGQFTTLDLPAYAEQALSSSNTFALAYGAKAVTASRSEFGLRSDKSFAMQDAIFTLRGRFGWAHDFNPDRNIAATFQTLPGASFVVNGATPAHDAALTTASAEMKWLNGFSLAASFEGEFSSVTKSYAGKGIARYNW